MEIKFRFTLKVGQVPDTKGDFALVDEDIEVLQTIGSLKAISRHTSDLYTGLASRKM